jgi:hypothetical protein
MVALNETLMLKMPQWHDNPKGMSTKALSHLFNCNVFHPHPHVELMIDY